MSKKRTYIIVFIILVSGFLAGNLAHPQLLKLPNFPNIPFKLGLDLQGGIHLIYQADLAEIEKEKHASVMQGLRDVIERRVDLFGVREPLVQTQEVGGRHRLVVELAGIEDPKAAIEMIGQTPFLEFREERDPEQRERILAKQREIEGKTLEEIQKIEDWHLAFEDPFFVPTPLTGKYLERAEIGFDQVAFQPLVLLQFNEEGSKIFENLTARNIGKILAIYIDGVPVTTPVVREVIAGGQAQISGNFTIEEARALARNLNAGALPVPITLISHQSVGPTLGAISLEKSLKAAVIGFLAITLFMILFYRLPGILAILALAIYLTFILTIFKLIPVTLTLAGIGGLILSLGMAIDANILIFSRMREELRKQKSFAEAIEEGFNRAWSSIRDGNLTTLIATGILFGFGTGFVKGFATTLSLGILLSMFSAIFITKNFLRCFVGTKLEKWKWLWY